MLSLALPSTGGNPAATSARSQGGVQLHPVVLASILDSHLRRPADHDRVLGTLLGPRSSAQVTEAFSVPYAVRAKGQVTIDVEHHRAMVDLHLKQNPKLVVLGWFATHPQLNSFSALIHNFYAAEALPTGAPAVHLALDPESLHFETYTAQPLLGGSDGGLAFTPVPHSVLVAPHERPSLDLLSSRLSSLSNLVPAPPVEPTTGEDLQVPTTPLEALYALLRQVTAMLDQVLDYVKQVASGQREGDDKVARALLETVGSVPQVTPAPVEKEAGEEESSSRAAEGESSSATAAGAAANPIADFEEEFNAHLADVLMVRPVTLPFPFFLRGLCVWIC
jgi:translation initiation factor 3 subunit F